MFRETLKLHETASLFAKSKHIKYNSQVLPAVFIQRVCPFAITQAKSTTNQRILIQGRLAQTAGGGSSHTGEEPRVGKKDSSHLNVDLS